MVLAKGARLRPPRRLCFSENLERQPGTLFSSRGFDSERFGAAGKIMKLEMFVEAYRLGGLDALNVALNGLSELERHSFLRKLEVIGYTIRWRKAGS